MNLIQGKLVDAGQTSQILADMPQFISETLNKPPLPAETVIAACEVLAATLPDEAVLPVMTGLGMGRAQALAYLADLRLMFSRPYLEQRLRIELGENHACLKTTAPFGANRTVEEQVYPLGVLFHIAAGNMDGLPAYSVIEGLLAGNINLLKLPSVDGGLTVMLLQTLCALAPALAEYIYVFELSSAETTSIRELMTLADAVVVWGGDEAVAAIRKIAPSNIRIIEWGHKLSFAYITQSGVAPDKLEALAHHVCLTNQLLCSSCQGIFLDTDSREEAAGFCRLFLPILDAVSQQYPDIPLSAQAQNTLQLRSRKLEQVYGDTAQIFKGRDTSLILETDSDLAVSLQFRNLWVKTLRQNRMITHLHPYKNHLQTAALLCGEAEWESLRDKLWCSGVVRISGGREMSESYCGAAHDGEYTLRRYSRIVAAQR